MPALTDPPAIAPAEYLRVLRRRYRIVLATVMLVLAAALVTSLLQAPVYRGTAEVLLVSRSQESLFSPQTGQRADPERAVETEIRVLEGQPVRDRVRAKLGTVPSASAVAVRGTDVIKVRVESNRPRQAALIANSYATAYINFRREQTVNGLLEAANQIQAKIAELEGRIGGLDQQLAVNPGNRTVSDQRGSLAQQQGLFRQKLDQLQVDAALKDGGAQVVTPAVTPRQPISPQPVRNGILGLVVGLLLGGGGALLLERLDDSITMKEDLERATGPLPVLGLIPDQVGWKDRDTPYLATLSAPRSPAAEAYRSLRTSVSFYGVTDAVRMIQVTSPTANEGKTTTIANLAVTLAQAGKRVLIVCCDLRRARVHAFFGLSNRVGLTSVAVGDATLEEAVQRVPDVDNLSLLASGPLPANPAEMLSSHAVADVLAAAAEDFDVVLLDCPPLVPVTDAAVLSNRVDATLVVARAGLTTRRALDRALELLRQVEAPLIGTVLNGLGVVHGYAGYYQYAYYLPDLDGSARPAPADSALPVGRA